MARRPRQSAEQVKKTVLDAMASYVRKGKASSDLWIPPIDDTLREWISSEQRPTRSSLYRVWPSREDLINDLIRHLLLNDLYNTSQISKEHQEVAGTIESMPLEPQVRKKILLAMARVAVVSTNHIVVSRVEVAASSRIDEFPDLEDALTSAQEQYINSLANGYELIHARLGDSVIDGHDFTIYSRTVATSARAIGLNSFGLEGEAYEAQYQGFEQIADRFTVSA